MKEEARTDYAPAHLPSLVTPERHKEESKIHGGQRRRPQSGSRKRYAERASAGWDRLAQHGLHQRKAMTLVQEGRAPDVIVKKKHVAELEARRLSTVEAQRL